MIAGRRDNREHVVLEGLFHSRLATQGLQRHHVVRANDGLQVVQRVPHFLVAEDPTLAVSVRVTDIEPQQEALPESVAGHSFTFGAKTSTSGRLMPEHFIRQRFDEAPEQVFSRVGFSGDHTRTIALVESGTYDVGAVNFTVWQAAVEDGRVDTDKVEVIWESPTYPDYQWTLRGDADERYGEGFTQKVQQALVDMTDPALLESFPRSGFIPASNDDYGPIESVGKSIGLLR